MTRTCEALPAQPRARSNNACTYSNFQAFPVCLRLGNLFVLLFMLNAGATVPAFQPRFNYIPRNEQGLLPHFHSL